MGRVKKVYMGGEAATLRYQARYLDERGKERSAGYFRKKEDAERAIERAEAKAAEAKTAESHAKGGSPTRRRGLFG